MSVLAMVGTLYWFSLALFVPLIRRSYLCSFLFFYKPAFFSIAHRYVYKLTESNPEQCTCILHSLMFLDFLFYFLTDSVGIWMI